MSSAADKQRAEDLARAAEKGVQDAWSPHQPSVEDRTDALRTSQISATLALVYATLATVK